MKKYDIFRSEGGYRVCGGVWGDDPIIDASPWYETEEEAKEAARKMRFDDCSAEIGLFEDFPDNWVLSLNGEFYNCSHAAGIKMARKALVDMGFTDEQIDLWRPDLIIKD